MTNRASHVQDNIGPRTLWEELRTRILASGEAQRYPFRRPMTGKRSYPGEAEANSLLAYTESLSRIDKEAFLKLIRTLIEAEQAILRKDVGALYRLMHGMGTVYNKLTRMIERKWACDVREDGLVVQPKTLQGKAALAVLLLNRQGRLRRIKKCKHCERWFYARFSHEKFCSKKCQEDDYHTPRWRKKNRERNRMHQREYRERNPGRKR